MIPSSPSPLPKGLLDCPTEILDSICQSLSQRDLRTLCLVCDALCSVSQPHVYSQIDWKWEKDQIPPIVLLLRSITSKPQLAAHIQTLRLNGEDLHATHLGYRPPGIPVVDELQDLVALIYRTKVPYASYWTFELYNGKMDAFVAVLLSQLTHLQSLQLGNNFTNHGDIIGMMLRSSLCDPMRDTYNLPKFEFVKNATFDRLDYSRGYKHSRNTEDALSLFYFPNIQHIMADIQNPIIFSWPGTYPSTLSSLTSLHLYTIRESHLSHILSATPNLKTLFWEWYYYENLEDQFVTPIINLTRIVESLLPIQNTLTQLTISAHHREITPTTLTFEGSLSGIVDFEHLQRFKVPASFLLGFLPAEGSQAIAWGYCEAGTIPPLESVIPRNIEHLVITDHLSRQEENELDDFTVLGAIRLWLRDWRTTNPNLRGLSLLLWLLDGKCDAEWNPEMQDKLKEVCLLAKVPLEIGKVAGSNSPSWHVSFTEDGKLQPETSSRTWSSVLNM